MSQPVLTESPTKTKQRIAGSETQPPSARLFHGGLNPILQLQRTLGNHQVAQLIKAKRLTPDGKIIGLQPKLTVGAADDQYEQEADRVARQVVSMPDSVAMASQQASPVEGETSQTKVLQSKPLPLAAAITPFAQRQIKPPEEIEEEKDKDRDRDESLQAKFFNKSTALPLQRQTTTTEKESEALQAKPLIQRDVLSEDDDKIQTKSHDASLSPFLQRQTQNNEELNEEATPIQAKRLIQSCNNPLQRQSVTEEEEQTKSSIQTKSDASLSGSFEAGEAVESRLSQSKGSGSQLPDTVRTYMEPRFGVDFSHVRVHTGSNATQMNRDVGAQAFTHGSDIYYGAGSSPTNLELTAHELTHVVQQTGGLPLQSKRGDEAKSSVGMQTLARLRGAEMAPGMLQPKKTAPTSSAAAGAGSPAKPAAKPEAQGGPKTPSAGAPPKTAASHSEKTKADSSTGKETGGVTEKGVKPEGKASSPREAIGPAIDAVGDRAANAREHPSADVPVASAQEAAKDPHTEQTRSAASETVANLNDAAGQSKNIKRDEFKQKLKEAIRKSMPEPETEAAAKDVMSTGATKASNAMHGQMVAEREAAAGPLKSTDAKEVPPSNVAAPPTTPLRSEPVGSPPPPVPASPVVPAALPPEQLDYSADREPADKLMAENKIKKEQLQKGNEPAFGATLAARSGAEKNEAAAKGKYRQFEAGAREKAQGTAQATLAGDLSGMHGDRAKHIGKVAGKQTETKSKNAQERQRITDAINGIKNKTKADVDAILEPMESKAESIFQAGLAEAETAYSATFDEAKGGVGTWLTTWGDDWKKLIEQSLRKARAEYLSHVDTAIDKVADYVDLQLAAAKKRVADGLKETRDFVGKLDQSVAQMGQEALQAVSGDFEAMTAEIDERRDKLIDKLVEQYKASSERMSAMEESLREENKSLWERVYDATVGLIEKILAFKDMLLGILGKAAGVIDDIVNDPIRFLRNLVSGIAQGLQKFMANIGTHLKKGLMDWLFGALGGAGLQLPDTFDLKGIISIVLQVLGLTYANFRARAVKIVGEKTVAALEKTVEVFKVLITEGISGLWRFIQEKVSDLKEMVLDAILGFIKDSVIIAGIKWVIGLLNPASAFFKACMAIYDIVMFFINRGAQIIELVNAVTDSVASIAKGSLGTAVGMVEGALAKAIPVTIGFLAGLLGLGDISGTVKKTIDKAQAPVNKAIDWVINMAVKGLKKLGGFLGFGKKDKDGKDKTDETSDVREAAGNALAQKLGHEATTEDTEQAAVSVTAELKPEGLKRIFLGPENEDGDREVFAEASPPKRIRILARKKIIVAIQANVTVTGEPISSGLEGAKFSKFDKERAAAMGGTGEAAVLPEVSQPPGTPARKGSQPSSGLVIKPEAESRQLEVVAWNTRAPEKTHNVSHAERQFIDWFESQNQKWINRVISVDVLVFGREICDVCASDIKNLKARYKHITFNWRRGDPGGESERKEKRELKP